MHRETVNIKCVEPQKIPIDNLTLCDIVALFYNHSINNHLCEQPVINIFGISGDFFSDHFSLSSLFAVFTFAAPIINATSINLTAATLVPSFVPLFIRQPKKGEVYLYIKILNYINDRMNLC